MAVGIHGHASCFSKARGGAQCEALRRFAQREIRVQKFNRGIFSTADRLRGSTEQLELGNRGSLNSDRDSKKVLYTIELPFEIAWHLTGCRRDTVVRAPKSA